MPINIRRVTIEIGDNEEITADMIAEAINKLCHNDDDNADDGNPEPVHIAAEKDDVSTLWSYPTSELSKPDKYGRSALHYAVRGHAVKAITYILNQGVSANIVADYNATPLHMATIRGYSDIAMLLLSNGADLKAIDEYDDTPLHNALYNKDESPETYELLINYYKDNLMKSRQHGEDECIICADENKKPDVVYIPCGHRCMCKECEEIFGQKRCHHAKCYDKSTNKCPVCRGRIMETMIITP